MIKDILKTIKNDLEKQVDLNSIDTSDILLVHFGYCAYIRNKYLWHNPDLVKELNKHFNTNHVDDLSMKIFEEIRKEDF